MRGRATIKDIARETGVSNVTISRVVNTPDQVAPETRARVEAAMARLGYVPNLAARAMRTRATRTIGCLVPDILSFSNAAVAQAAERALAAEGYGMMLVSAGERPEDEVRALDMLRLHRVDGLLVYIGSESDARMIEALRGLETPLLVLDRTLPIAADTVFSDHGPAMREAVAYLRALGHRRIVFLSTEAPIRPVVERKRAFAEATGDLGESARIIGVRGPDKAHFRAEALFSGSDAATAVIVDGSRLLRSVVDAVRVLGLSVPGDLSIIGLDVEDVAPTMTPEVTRITRDYGEIGRTAARLVLDRITEGAKGPKRSALLGSHVVLKGSCGPAEH
ncbi:transcriptional regulator, LacI family [Devosia enhydra]|uniref:Transcriptional regulator, LacI family n=1 Tax=Devosia enhydra TaxID=665118 RepID=A0A1K2I1X8_9HYPH|nr:LacI family DNA-binding transcriptional regulator [Devosia enhydra]SFZ86337.1 transcriptional regulator, LacI family [Devosia enhydra]